MDGIFVEIVLTHLGLQVKKGGGCVIDVAGPLPPTRKINRDLNLIDPDRTLLNAAIEC